jgi:hypothetical protein
MIDRSAGHCEALAGPTPSRSPVPSARRCCSPAVLLHQAGNGTSRHGRAAKYEHYVANLSCLVGSRAQLPDLDGPLPSSASSRRPPRAWQLVVLAGSGR